MGMSTVQLKERKTLTLSDFRGVDFSSSPFSVAHNRAVDMENLMISNGRICKRPGWEVVADASSLDLEGRNEYRINAIYCYENETKKIYIVIVDNRIYAFDKDSFLKGDLSNRIGSHHAYSVAKNCSASFFPMDENKLLIFYGGLLIFDGEKFTLATDEAYIPTTSISYGSVEPEKCRLATKEKINMLTRWRKNQLKVTEETEETEETTVCYTFKLDAYIKDYFDAKIEALFPSNVYSSDYIKLTSAPYSEVEDSYYLPEDLNDYVGENILVLVGESPYGGKENFIYASISSSDIVFSGYIISDFYRTNDEITVTYCADGDDKSKIFKNCKLGTLFGCNGNANCLLLTGNSEHKNTVYYSQIDDYLYFPDTNYFTVGSADNYVSGFLRLEDDTLAVFKDGEGSDSRMYYVKGSELSEYDSDGALKWYTLKCTVSAGGIGEWLIAPSSIATLAGDKLILSDNGVKGIVMSDNSFTTARYARDRSYNINARLCKEENLSEAVGFAYKNRYYLAVNDVCYVADPDYRFYRDTDKDQSFNYEWWYWTNIPACCFAEIEGELWFGTKNGAICRFKKDSYTDDERYELPDAWTKLTEDVEKDRLVYGGKSVIDGEDEEIVFYPSKNGKETVIKGETDLTRVPLFMVRGSYTEDGETFPYIKLKLHENDENTIDIKEFTPGEFRAMLIKRTPVAARWVSPYFDMGSNVYLKTLLRLTVSADSAVGEKLRFGYQTKQGSATHELQGHSYMDFEDMSFCDFSFDTKFADSYTKKLNVRNFNYIQFRFVADGKENVAINDLTATYKINKLSRGVR